MSDIPALPVLLSAAKDLVTRAKKEDSLSALTARIVRKELEARFKLDEGVLNASEYKKPLTDAIHKFAEEEEDKVSESEADVASAAVDTPEPEPLKAQAKKRKSKSPSESAPKAKKARPSIEPTRKKSSEKAGKYKSASVIATSDMEVDEDDLAPPTPKAVKRKTVSKANASSSASKSKAVVDSDSEVEEVPSKPAPKEKKSQPKAVKNVESDSEVEDEPPKRKKRASKDKSNAEPKTRTKKADVTLTKDEETVKKLKSFVTACGVRKIWSKMFANAPEPSQQIPILYSILKDLGMSENRMSLEKAKAIRAKRELEQELSDIRAFDDSMQKRSSRSSKSKTDTKENSGSEEDEEDVAVPAKRKVNAKQSIMAFLDDQSDSE